VSDQGDVKDINRILEDIQRQIAEQERAIYTPTVIEHAIGRMLAESGKVRAATQWRFTCAWTKRALTRRQLE
jgi:hypothetical protein